MMKHRNGYAINLLAFKFTTLLSFHALVPVSKILTRGTHPYTLAIQIEKTREKYIMSINILDLLIILFFAGSPLIGLGAAQLVVWYVDWRLK